MSPKTANCMQVNPSLRQSIIQQRKALSSALLTQFESRICRQIIQSHYFRSAKKIAIYYPVSGEVGTWQLLERIWSAHKRAYLPVLHTKNNFPLRFAEITSQSRFVDNQFGIPEPDVPYRNLLKPQQMDLVCVPLVGFDMAGHRLGMGGGYYDRSFAFVNHRHTRRPPYLVGLAYEFQKCSQLIADAWDVDLDAIITEDTLYAIQHHKA